MSDPSTPNPQNQPHDTTSDVVASSTPPSPDLQSDIADELTDHLALSSRDLQLAGHSADESHQLAHQNFGDIAAIRRRLWWIHKGDEVMLRTAFALVLVVLFLAVAALGVGGWRMSQTIDNLGTALVTMNETQRALLETREKEDRPLAIRGRLYIGDKSRPASYASVDVYQLPDGKRVDRLLADKDGRFGTSSLQAGHYTLLAGLVPNPVDAGKPRHLIPAFFAIQSRPISIYPWSQDTTVELDVTMVGYGQVSFELTKPFSRAIQLIHGASKITIYPSLVIAIPSSSKELPISRLGGAENLDWPIVGLIGRREAEIDVVDAAELAGVGNAWETAPVPAGESFVFRRVPDGSHAGVFRAGVYPVAAYVGCRYITSTAGTAMPEGLPASDATQLPDESRGTIEVVNRRRMHLRITPPSNLEDTLRKEVESALGGEAIDTTKISAIQQKPIPVKLELVGQMDVIDAEKLRADDPRGGYGGYGHGSRTDRGGYGAGR